MKKYIFQNVFHQMDSTERDQNYWIVISVPEHVTKEEIHEAIHETHKELQTNGYGLLNYNAHTLFGHVCQKHPEWKYHQLLPAETIHLYRYDFD